MPGWVNYFYKDGICPSHTKSTFTQLNVLTVQNIILKNILLFMNKIHNYSHLLPASVINTISPESPSPSSPTDYNSIWYTQHNSAPYNTSTFFKGPLLYTNIMTTNTEPDNTSLNTYKRGLKAYLLSVQSSGDPEEWSTDNFRLTNLQGLRISARIKAQGTINYTE